MATRKTSIARCAIAGLVALLIGAPVALARPDPPMTPEQAQLEAMRYGNQAAHLRTLGGVAYKSGELQRAEYQQAKYTAMAEELAAPTRPPSRAVAEHYAEVAEHYRAMGGGPAYKWRRVAEAEAQQRNFESIEAPPEPASSFGIEVVEPPPPSPADHPACETVSKPVVRTLACAR